MILPQHVALVLCTLACTVWAAPADKHEDKLNEKLLKKVLPSKYAVEQMGIQFLDALIKKGQVEMAKNAFRTQLDVLKKVNPSEFKKYKKLKVADMATDAVMQQAAMAKLQPKTGNHFVDMLNENGIPIASSLKGIEQAIRTQKELENNDPSEQIAMAVFEKFQQQILPGLVANMVAGRNPFKMPHGIRRPQQNPEVIRAQALAAQRSVDHLGDPFFGDQTPRELRMKQRHSEHHEMHMNPRQIRMNEIEEYADSSTDSRQELLKNLRRSSRLRNLLQNPRVASLMTSRRADSPLSDRAIAEELDDAQTERMMRNKAAFDGKAAVVLGLHDLYHEDEKDEIQENSIRRSSLSLPSNFLRSLEKNREVKNALEKLDIRTNDIERYLLPKNIASNPDPQPGYFIPRRIPKRPRKMIPLLIGMDPKEQEEIRRTPSLHQKELFKTKSRTLTNLHNNPNIAPLFLDPELERKLAGREILTPEQKGRTYTKVIKAYPRLYGSKTLVPMDAKVSQMIEERPVPPMHWTPKGRHTRVRWTGATEKEIPGIGGRFILPSLDPTAPAVNTAYSTQGRAREEWDTMFKVPNSWNAGDEFGFSMKQKSRRFVGGNGGFDMPAAHLKR